MPTEIPTTSQSAVRSGLIAGSDTFARRHLGPNDGDIGQMLALLGVSSLDELMAQTVPESIRMQPELNLPFPRTESEALADLKAIASKNRILRSMIGQGYSDCITPPVILRNILENPGWYTQYTPYQAEISQGRMEALINFQTMVCDLTALPLANASLLDEPTAAAEAMAMCHSSQNGSRNRFLVARDCHPQTIAVVKTRGKSMGIQIDVVDIEKAEIGSDVSGILIQYPNTNGTIIDHTQTITRAHANGAMVVMACDLLALTLLKAPGEFGADIAIGSAQRFGVPMGFGGPHAGFMATKSEFARKMPGRLIGVSRDVHGNPAYRLTLQTREQHIRREKATSNICTAQVLLAVIASMYAVYHGPEGLRTIASRIATLTDLLSKALTRLGHDVEPGPVFDTLKVRPGDITADQVIAVAQKRNINLRSFTDGCVGISLDETTTLADVQQVLESFATAAPEDDVAELVEEGSTISPVMYPTTLARSSAYLTHPVFGKYHCETEMLRYIFKLMNRDLSLAQSMIPLGSCTMKLNGTSEMIPVTWPAFGRMHPLAPSDQWRGYAEMFSQLEKWLSEITGFAATSLQPNAGSQGEYAGLLAIRGYHESRGQSHRNICLIPTSAHGTNPASAVIAGFNVVAVACDEVGNVDLDDLQIKAKQHAPNLAAVMVTYPSTHGVFEAGIKELCRIVHDAGGQVYMDGANMNAQVGLCRPGDIGADVCHLNLHKTFCIPHGGGGPGMGPICVAKHLAPFLPSRSAGTPSRDAVGPVSGAPYGSASILPISWVYIALMGGTGLKKATQVAILNANYMAKRLEGHYDILFRGENGRCAHEFIVDLRPFETSANVKAEDVAKRLMDYGFHAPTMSWPVPGTLMIEPTESESKQELDRFCEAMILIRQEIAQIESGKFDRTDNPLKNAPHTASHISSDTWNHKYTRDQAAYPAPWLKDFKFWPFVGRVDNPYGDRNLFCSCIPQNA